MFASYLVQACSQSVAPSSNKTFLLILANRLPLLRKLRDKSFLGAAIQAGVRQKFALHSLSSQQRLRYSVTITTVCT